MRQLQTTQPSFQQGFLLELLVFLGLKNWKRSTNYSKRWTKWSNEAEEGQGGGETPGRSPSLDAQGADTLNTRVSGCSSLRPLQGGGNMGQGTSPL